MVSSGSFQEIALGQLKNVVAEQRTAENPKYLLIHDLNGQACTFFRYMEKEFPYANMRCNLSLGNTTEDAIKQEFRK